MLRVILARSRQSWLAPSTCSLHNNRSLAVPWRALSASLGGQGGGRARASPAAMASSVTRTSPARRICVLARHAATTTAIRTSSSAATSTTRGLCTSATAAASTQKEYTWSDIDSLRAAGRTVIVVRGCVYDVTEFVSAHPGGGDVVQQETGEAGEAFDLAGHSDEAYDQVHTAIYNTL